MEKEKYYGQTVFFSFDVIFLQMKFWLQLCNFQQYTCLKAKLELLKKKKKSWHPL